MARKNLIACLACIASVTAILYWRRPDAFYNPQFWAEDGSRFFTSAFFQGWRTFGIPYAGYFHFLARSVAWLCSWLPVSYAPHGYNFAAWLFLAGLILYIFSERFTWGWTTKFLMGLALVTTSAGNEVFFNLANWATLSSFFWLLLAVANEPQSKSQINFDVVLLLLTGLNSPFVVCLWPLFLWRWHLRRTRPSLWLLGASLIVVVIQVWNMPARVVTEDLALEMTPVFWDALVYPFGFMFLGDSIYQLHLTDTLRVYGVVVMAVFYGWLFWHGLQQKNWALMALIADGLFANGLSLYVIRHNLSALAYYAGGRHFYIPVVTLMWGLLVSDLKTGFARRWALGMMYVAFVVLTPGTKNQVWPDLDWAGYVAQCTGTQPLCKIPILPARTPPVWFARMSSHVFDQPTVSHPLAVRFGEQMELLGYDNSQTLTGLNLKLIWHVIGTSPADLKFFVHVYPSDNPTQILLQTDEAPLQGKYPTSQWVLGEFIADEVELSIASLSSGEYLLGIGWYDPATLTRLPAYDMASGEDWRNDVVLVPVKIEGP